MSASTLNRNAASGNLIPRSCQRLRLPSLTAALRSQSHKPDYGSQSRKEQRRIVVMGSAKVGKSSIISQFLYDKYLTRYRETVEELHRGEYELPDGASLTLDILDTSGAFQFPAMRALSISTGGAFILVYAVDDEETWTEVVKLREQVSAPTLLIRYCSIHCFADRFLYRIYFPADCDGPWFSCANRDCGQQNGCAVQRAQGATRCGRRDCHRRMAMRLRRVFGQRECWNCGSFQGATCAGKHQIQFKSGRSPETSIAAIVFGRTCEISKCEILAETSFVHIILRTDEQNNNKINNIM